MAQILRLPPLCGDYLRPETEKKMNLSESQANAMIEIGEMAVGSGHIPRRVLEELVARKLIYWSNPTEVEFTPTGEAVYELLVASEVQTTSGMETATQTFRVLGINSDGSRTVLDEGLTHMRAEQIKQLLLDGNAFATVKIELE
jgi:hypothetical protein